MRKNILIITLIAILAGIGCSSKKSQTATPPVADTPSAENPVDTGNPGGSGTGGGLGDSGGDTVDFKPVSFAMLSNYVGTHPLNSPSNIKINVNLTGDELFKFSGSVRISYEDNGQTWSGLFESSADKNVSMSGLRDNDVPESTYNFWFKKDNKLVFTGMFQDQYGAIALVIDNVINQGDGQGSSYVSGSVYFRNFAQSHATQSPYRKCWFIYTGPYDCRSTTLISKTGLYPTTDEGYRKLGTFTGLSRTKAFNL